MPPSHGRSVEDSLRDALLAATEIIEWTSNKTFTDYTTDKRMRYSLERQFEVLGESLNAADRIEENLRHMIPEIGEFIGLRNVITHAYFRIDDEVIWSAIRLDIPLIQARIVEYLGNDHDPSGEDPNHSVE